MTLTVWLSSSLRRAAPGYDPANGMAVEAAPGASVADICQAIGIDPSAVKIVMVDGRARSMDHRLEGHERIALFPPVGGG